MDKKEQLKRIQNIMNSSPMIKCTHCKESYVALKEEFEDYCPICNESFIERIPEEETEYISHDEIWNLIR